MKNFRKLTETDKNICFLHTANKGKCILAANPIAEFSESNIEKFERFCEKHRKNLLIGYISYDLAYKLYEIKQKAKNDLKLPIINFFAFKNWQEWTNSGKKAREIIKNSENINLKTIITKKEYHSTFKKIKNYIRQGEIYQVNLTHRLEGETTLNGRELFLQILTRNPVDYSAYLETKNAEILSASPESFIKIHKNKIETCPIKGTRPRGKTTTEDKKMAAELLKNEKEKAELNMITDLLRNDLNKICKAGTVKVIRHRILQKCPTVWHTYSKIEGIINVKPIQALLSMLPGGSITGCPKKRAIEIIDELEPKTRGVYTGVIGYISPYQKEVNFNIAIRTLIKKKQKIYLQVGGGIVIDSNEKAEFEETMNKAASFLR
ncbi:anthranilate synthase component I family protein [Candidatus Peregrinibacteria bacterium]|nr:anthranilate synthase component I family protein [Candidatus Peregrinibacteria bacterium]